MIRSFDDIYKSRVDPIRAINMIRFHNLGDALGAPYEYSKSPRVVHDNINSDNANNITVGLITSANIITNGSNSSTDNHRTGNFDGKLNKEVMVRTRFQGCKIYPSGSTTDDTRMTLTLLRALITYPELKNSPTYDLSQVTQIYMDSVSSYKGQIGINTRRLLKYKKYSTYIEKYTKAFPSNNQSSWSQSNGSLMRCSPLAIANRIDYFIDDAKITNPHPVNIFCSFIYGTILSLAIRGFGIELIRYLVYKIFQLFETDQNDNGNNIEFRRLCRIDDLDHLGNLEAMNELNKSIIETLLRLKITHLPFEVMDVYLDVSRMRPRNIATNRGHVVHALYFVLMYLFGSDCRDYMAIMKEIIELGGDTDTNAAIVGAMIGALHNEEVPLDLISKFDIISRVNEINYYEIYEGIVNLIQMN